MKIKVSDRYMYAVSPCNIRQWVAALLQLPGVQYVPESSEEWADVGIDCKNNVRRTVLIDLSDPWSLVNTLPVDELVDAKLKSILTVPYQAPSEAFAHVEDLGVDYYDSFDVYATMISYAPLKKHLQPLFSHANLYPLLHSLPENQFFTSEEKRELDVFFTGAMDSKWYPLRNIVQKELQQHLDIVSEYGSICGNIQKHKINGSYNTRAEQIQAYDEQMFRYADKFRSAKITIFDGTIFNIPVKKYIEAMACGCLVLAPMPLDADLMGFVDGVNMVVVDETNFMDKCRYYLEHEEERKQITDAAYNLYQERHTCTKSAERFLAYLKTR